jgi:hypothetical protein
METLFEYVAGFVVLVIASFICYMSVHIQEEKRANKYLALPWEDFKEFKKWFTGKSND